MYKKAIIAILVVIGARIATGVLYKKFVTEK